MMLDDHEIRDNWAPLPAGADAEEARRNRARGRAGVAAYVAYQRNDPGGVGLRAL